MSNFAMKATNLKTGEVVNVLCMDDYFGNHQFGYGVGDKVYSEAAFYEVYEPLASESQ